MGCTFQSSGYSFSRHRIMISAIIGIDTGVVREKQEREHYTYQLACVVDGGLLLHLSHEASFGIGRGAEGTVQRVHRRGRE